MLWIYVNGDVSVTNINCVPWVTCSINNKIRGMIKYLVLYSTCINTYDPHTVFIHTSNITSNFESLISLLNIIYCTTNIAPIYSSILYGLTDPLFSHESNLVNSRVLCWLFVSSDTSFKFMLKGVVRKYDIFYISGTIEITHHNSNVPLLSRGATWMLDTASKDTNIWCSSLTGSSSR